MQNVVDVKITRRIEKGSPLVKGDTQLAYHLNDMVSTFIGEFLDDNDETNGGVWEKLNLFVQTLYYILIIFFTDKYSEARGELPLTSMRELALTVFREISEKYEKDDFKNSLYSDSFEEITIRHFFQQPTYDPYKILPDGKETNSKERILSAKDIVAFLKFIKDHPYFSAKTIRKKSKDIHSQLPTFFGEKKIKEIINLFQTEEKQ